MNSCSISYSEVVENSKVFTALRKKLGTNDTLYGSYYRAVISGDEFSKDFVDWYKTEHKSAKEVTINATNAAFVIKEIIKYYNRKHPDGNDTVLDYKNNIYQEYTSVNDRNFCIEIVASEILDIYRDRKFGKHIDANRITWDEYKNLSRISFLKRLFDRVKDSTGLSEADIKAKLNKDRFINTVKGYMNLGEEKQDAITLATYQEMIKVAEEIMGNDITDQDSNFFATFREMINSTKDAINGEKISDLFFDTVKRDKRLTPVRQSVTNEFKSDQEEQAQDNEDVELGENDDDDVSPNVDTFDISFRVFEHHDGLYSNFIVHVNGEIKTYLNSLRRLSGTGTIDGKPYYNTNNPIGIADTMNDSECAIMLYTAVDYTNVDSMIQSIKRIGETVAGYEAFTTLASDLSNNYDFAYQIYTTFGKSVMSKLDTIIMGDNIYSRISNPTSDRTNALRLEYISSLKSSTISIDYQYISDEIKKLEQNISSLNDYKKLSDIKYNAKLQEVIDNLTKLLGYYYNTIDKSAIRNFISNNEVKGKVDDKQNIDLLFRKLKDTADESLTTKNIYTSKLIDSAAARKSKKDTSEIWAESYLSKGQEQTAIQLANMLVPYSLVKTELNSNNVRGKKSSDVINSSMITALKNILKNAENYKDSSESPLRNYAKYKFRGKQYDLSNILLEHKEGNTIINYGLFRQEGEDYVPTEYATELIDMFLFDGANDLNSDKAALYSEMSKGDYIATAMANFFKANKSLQGHNDIVFADYFMRTPSDAPKNFIFRAPRYSISQNDKIKFWNIDNEAQVDADIATRIDSIPVTDLDYVALNSQELDKRVAFKLLSGRTVDSIEIEQDSSTEQPDKNNNVIYMTVSYNGFDFLIKGKKVENVTKRTKEIQNVSLVGTTTKLLRKSDIGKSLADYIKREMFIGNMTLSDGTAVTKSINREHPIFKQFVNAFRQEMTNAATAIDKMFSHKNGFITIVDGEPQFNEIFAAISNKERATYANYHHKKNTYGDVTEKGIVQNLWRKVDGVWEKTPLKRLSGNVFTSDKFTITDRNTGETRNYMDDVIREDVATVEDGTIHFLYGGANTHLHINSDGSVEFTPAQQARIEQAVSNFITDYINESIDRISNFENLLTNIPHSEDNITEFMLNYRLAYINCNDLFEGDTKFYKDTQDFLKRAKEVQGSGVPYAIADFSKPMFGQVKVEAKNSYLNSAEMQKIVASLNDCKQYTTFKAATITNSIITSKETQTILVDQLKNNFIKEGFTEEEATKKAKTMMAGYAETTVNDAQSYITFEEWIRRVAAKGQLYKYKPLIEAILDESKPIDSTMIDEFVQVQKNFYYDMYYDELTGVMAPRQVKNAEFVLVPRFIKGTELEIVYNCMTHYGIDQLNTEETTKAGKHNVLTIWDKNGNITNEWTADFNKNINDAIEVYDYNYLYSQQEAVQHVNAENKAGIQIMKKIIDNIPPTSSLYSIKEDFMNLYSYNIYESFVNIVTELGAELDENEHLITDEDGNVKGIDVRRLYARLEEEMMRRGLDSNMLDYCTLEEFIPEDESGNNGLGIRPKMPAFFNSTKNTLENVAQAIFNNSITRQKLPGFHAEQVTRVGFEYTKKDNQIRKDGNLRYHPNGEKYIEVMISASNFGLDKNDSKYEGMTDEEIKINMLKELELKGLDIFIGYRIPTEGKQSVALMKVVDFVDDSQGSTIVVPDDWVAQTGSDFDFDSIYGIQYASYKVNGSLTKPEYTDDTKQLYKEYVLSNLSKEARKELYNKAKVERVERAGIAIENQDSSYVEYLDKVDEETNENRFFYAKQYAEEYGLMSYDEFVSRPIEALNSREARTNKLIECMIEILKSDESLEENLSRSNFKDITTARDRIIKGTSIEYTRQGRSAFDFLDQADYQEDAMSGAKLKGFSVTRDNFCSVCNTVRPTLMTPIAIYYTGDDAKLEELKKSFDIVDRMANGKIRVLHNTFGWSKNNRNVEGKLITVYSSETTAHILDAIKEGAIPNVNDLTFGVYKTFPDIGSDYNTAVAFMMQPGVTRIVDAYNRTKSVYSKDYDKPVDEAIREIAKRLGIDTKINTVKTIRKALDKMVDSRGINQEVFDAEVLVDRIKNTGWFATASEEEKALFDYKVIDAYRNLSNIAKEIGDIARVTNPDKFGAKQSIFATNKVFDDIQDIIDNRSNILSVKKGGRSISIIEAIYPDIHLGLDGYVKSNNNNSSYKPLHYFLKYASGTSVKINRSLFETQTPGFRDIVDSIKIGLSGENPIVTEKLYNDFERYVLTAVYNNVDIISRPTTYEYGRGIVQTTGNKETETKRLFGYGYKADLTIQNDNESDEFTPEDINHPTEDELDNFAKFTPAQKVLWIQRNFRDGLICKYITPKLFDDRRNYTGQQTISFIEDGHNMDEIYEEFRKTFMNENPLLVMTAMDIIKYAFVVEGYKNKKRNITRVIDNDVLINSLGFEGTGIVESIRRSIANLAKAANVGKNWVDMSGYDIDTLVKNYIRSHSNIREIAHTYFTTRELNSDINPRTTDGKVIVFESQVDKGFLEQHNIIYKVEGSEGKYDYFINPYIVISFGKNNKVIYKIKEGNNTGNIYLYPITKLEENETSAQSANSDNNVGVPYTEDYYETLLEDYESTATSLDMVQFTELGKSLLESNEAEYRIKNNISENEDIQPIPFDILDEENGGISQLRQQIRNHFTPDEYSPLYIESRELGKHIFVPGKPELGLQIRLDKRNYVIYKVNTRPYYKYITEKGLSKTIPPHMKPMAEIIERVRQRGIEANRPGQAVMSNVFAVVPYVGTANDTGERSSSVTESIAKNVTDTTKAIRRKARSTNDESAEKFDSQMRNKNVVSSVESVANNLDDVVISTAEYVSTTIDNLLNGEHGLNFFTINPETGEYLTIYDDKTMELIRENAQLRREFLKTMLHAQHIVDLFDKFAKTTYDEENKHLETYINKINQAVKKLSESGILEKAEQAYVNQYLAKVTNNPNIRRDIVSLMDGFHTAGFLSAQLSDLQDISNPILQIITNDVMSDLSAKEYKAKEDVAAFKKFVEDIKSQAKAKGLSVNWDKIIDENGRFINNYNEKFLEDLDKYRNARNEAYSLYKQASSPVEKIGRFEDYLRKKLDYKKWALKNTNGEIKDEYIAAKIALDEDMLAHHKDIYVEYKMLTNELSDILSHTVNGKLDEHWEEERVRVSREIANLRSPAIIIPGGGFALKTDVSPEELSSDPVKRRKQIVNSRLSAEALDRYISENKKLDETIYEYNERFGFKDQLDKYLQIVKKRELRDEFGRQRASQDALNNDKEYLEAKEWLKNNAVFKYGIWNLTEDEQSLLAKPEKILIDVYNEDDVVESSLNLRVQAAINFLKSSVGERGNKKSIYKLLVKNNDARDEQGIVDGTKLSEEDRAAIKEEQEDRYNIGRGTPFNEKSIIHNSPSDDTIYTSEFYKGMNVGGVSNPEYLELVKEINSYLRRALDSSTGVLHTSELSADEIERLLELFEKLGYDSTEQTYDYRGSVRKKKGIRRKDIKAVREFIKKNVDFVTDDERFEIEKAKAKLKGERYYYRWQELNQEWDEDKHMFVPNHILWGYAKPKETLSDAEKSKFIAKAKTSAVRILNQVFQEKETKYYLAEYDRIASTYGVNSKEFKDWMEANHVYNPYTHKLEPLVCWTTSEVTEAMPGTWEPAYSMKERKVKEDAANKNYKPKLGVAANYKNKKQRETTLREKEAEYEGRPFGVEYTDYLRTSVPDGTYDRVEDLNEFEVKLKDEVQRILSNLIRNKEARYKFEQGFAPAKAAKPNKSFEKVLLKELAQSVGWIEGHNGKERWDKEISYATDYTPTMPLMQMLKTKDSIDLDKFEKENKPIRENYESDADYEIAKQEYDKQVKANKEHNLEIHKQLLDRDWESVISEFIIKASHYNAIQDNKYQLYFGQKLIQDIGIIEKDGTRTTDKWLPETYNNWIRRLVFDQWKKQQGNKTRAMQILQSLASTNYMTLNLRGGIANVLVGEVGILGEAFAKEYFGGTQWAAGKAIWAQGVTDYLANMYSEKSSTLAGAIVKGINVVDYDEYTGQVKKLDAEEISTRLRNISFGFLSSGEHFMQNGALFSMMLSHRIVRNPRYGEPGELEYAVMNEAEYTRYAEDIALGEICDESEIARYKQKVKNIKEDPNLARDFALYRKYPITEFVMFDLSDDKQRAFIEAKNRITKQLQAEFNTYDTFFSQFKLSDDGMMAFADDSIMSKLNVTREGQDVSDAYKLLGRFRERVVSVNKKIHGFYDKLGSARIESEWWGGIVMQYHKHIVPGILKRYRSNGYYNEARGTIEKGTNFALWDFLKLPIRKIAYEQGLSDAQTEAMVGIQNYIAYATDYIQYLKLAWNVIPDSEKANIFRGLQDIFGMTSALLMAMALRLGWDDDDDSLVYNLCLYEADRLATETGMYSIGAITEAKTLWSSPVAAQTILGDGLRVLNELSQIVIEGDDYDPYYHSGRYAGRSKLGVYVERRIPYWRNYVAIRDIADNNHYYRMGDNMLSILPVKTWTDKIKGKNN